jgi:hypothetical protein
MMVETSAFYGQPGITSFGLQSGFGSLAGQYGQPIWQQLGGPLAHPQLWGQVSNPLQQLQPFGAPLPQYGQFAPQGIGTAFALPQIVGPLAGVPVANPLQAYGPLAQAMLLPQILHQLCAAGHPLQQCASFAGQGIGAFGQLPLWGHLGGIPFGHALQQYGPLAGPGISPWLVQPQIGTPLAGPVGQLARQVSPQFAYTG